MWDRLVRRFQSPAEREAEGRRKGFSGVLEADLTRGEAKAEALQNPDSGSLFAYTRGPNGEILAEEKDEVPLSREEGLKRWQWEMEMRFIRGGDTDFDYQNVDTNEELDIEEDREAEEKYFGEEEPEYVMGQQSKELQGETGIQDY